MTYYLQYGIYLTILVTGFITGSIFYKKDNKKILPVIILLGYTFLSQTGSVLAAKIIRNNIPNEHLYALVSNCLWGWFFYINIEGLRTKAIIKWFTIGCVVFAVVNVLFLQTINKFPDNMMKLNTLSNLVWGAVLLIQLLDLPARQNVFQNPFFLVAVGLVWFNIISSFYFFLTVFLTKYQIFPSLLNIIHLISNYVFYLILFTAMFFLKKYNQDVRTIRS